MLVYIGITAPPTAKGTFDPKAATMLQTAVVTRPILIPRDRYAVGVPGGKSSDPRLRPSVAPKKHERRATENRWEIEGSSVPPSPCSVPSTPESETKSV
jgi:hypothetical protein